ncbi:hypothetical protein ALC57_14376, partial [Trachymyrmex cornetzi]
NHMSRLLTHERNASASALLHALVADHNEDHDEDNDYDKEMTVKLVRIQLSGFSAIRRMREMLSEESSETTESAFIKKTLVR